MGIRVGALGLVPVLMLAPDLSARVPAGPAADIDHVILQIDRLQAGIEEFARLTGITPVVGGQHPGRGTQNALVSLGPGRYLEIMAPLPTAEKPAPIKFARLTPTGWALRATNLAEVIARVKSAGFDTAGPNAGSRRLPDGSLLEWQTANARGAGLALAPFFIQWAAASAHPSTTSPTGCTLESVELTERAPAPLQRLFDAVGFDSHVETGEPAMRFTLGCPKGRVSFSR